MKINKDDIKKRIIYRASYRGTKELDILISSFINKIINNLNEEELEQLEKFVNLDDQELLILNKKLCKNKNQNLTSVLNGAVPIACNNEHFGRAENILAPGIGKNMGDGWETR